MIQVSDGTRLNVVDEGVGRPIVLIGGYGMPGAGWKLQRDHFRTNHRVITIDRRCHGESDRPSFGQRLSRHGKDVADVFDAMELDDVLLVGSSMGASTILAYVDLFGSSRLRGIVLIDQTPKMINEADWGLGFYGLTRSSVDEFVSRFPGEMKPFHTPPPVATLELMAAGTPFSIDATRDLLRDHTEADWRDVVARIDVPLLAIAGRQSPIWSWESSEWMATAAPEGSLVVLEESGHVPFLEEPAAFNEVLAKAAAN